MDGDTLQRALRGETFSESALRQICLLARERLMKLPNHVKRDFPVIVVGDIHGQFKDLLNMFNTVAKYTGNIEQKLQCHLVFLGDYVDRGAQGLKTFTLLLCLLNKYPDKVLLLRGNHECLSISSVYGFYDECQETYGNISIWKEMNLVFDLLPLTMEIDGSIFGVHGGLSPKLRKIQDIQKENRNMEIPREKDTFADLLWADPADDDSVEDFAPSTRGNGYVFGIRAVSTFLSQNGFNAIVRSHQLMNEGYGFCMQGKVATVWSAPNYCYRMGNKATVLWLPHSVANLTKSDFIHFDAHSGQDEERVQGLQRKKACEDYFV